jgi:hypothetical protein
MWTLFGRYPNFVETVQIKDSNSAKTLNEYSFSFYLTVCHDFIFLFID